MQQERLIALGISLLAGIVFVAILSLIFSSGFFADFMLDRNTSVSTYPFTIQNVMWLVFFVGLGELYLRFRVADIEGRQKAMRLLPEDDTIFRHQDIGELYKNVRQSDRENQHFLQRMIGRVVLQFQSSKSVGQANALFNSSLELYQHEIEMRYNMLRYIVWLIPTLGFIGTVVGIALALKFAGSGEIDFQSSELLVELTKRLGVAFNTTLLALLQSAVLMFMLHIAQGREEMMLNDIGQYCLDNLINRLYEN